MALRKKDKKINTETARKYYAKGYSDAGASLTKRSLKGFIAQSGAPKEDIDWNNRTLRQRCRMLYMATPLASGSINTTRTKVVGTGLHMKSTVDFKTLGISEEAARVWQRNTEAEWKIWADNKRNCDAIGNNNFYEMQQLAVKSWLMSGDVFALLKRDDPTPFNPYTLRLHIVEADRISTPTDGVCYPVPNATEGKNKNNGNVIYDGVEVNASGRVVAYHVCNIYPGQFTADKAEWERVEAEGRRTGLPNIIHVMDAERPEQYRGVSFLAPLVEIVLQLRRYTEAELMAALVQTYLTAWIQTDSDPSLFPLNEVGSGDIVGDGDNEVPYNNISDDENEYEIGPGTVNHLKPGESVVLGNPNVPVAGFEAFVKAIYKMCGASLEIPYDVLMKEFNASYSASKGALEEVWEMIKMRRAWFVADFCQPVYETWLAEAVATGRIKAPGFFTDPKIRKAWCGARWDGPAQTHLDPVKEATANEKAVLHGWKTNAQVARESYGTDWEENVTILKAENELYPFTVAEKAQDGGEADDTGNQPEDS